ncbi:hypothetical protein K438DRAFT_1827630 [Mycena galopus ATCC 62051]|nr:hypothetical protein K438DRAFT_1827630 [Mycena galopus ATCC 62051]
MKRPRPASHDPRHSHGLTEETARMSLLCSRIQSKAFLTEIFLLTMANSTLDSHVKDAFQVSHVCSEWRRIATGIAALWAMPIRVNLYPEATDTYADGLKAWLERSAPLSLSIHLQGPTNPKDWVHVSPRITDEILRISSRWRFLEPGTSSASFLSRFLDGSSFDNLEEMNLDDVEVDSTIPFFSTPRLRKLSAPTNTPFDLPWAQLTDLTLSAPVSSAADPLVILDTFARCPLLVKASVEFNGWWIPPSHSTVLPSHTQLRSLTLTLIDNTPHVLPFLDCISAPALERLILTFPLYATQCIWSEPQFTAFQLRSPNIAHLEISNAKNLTSDNLITALRHAPSLTRLTLDRVPHGSDAAFINALANDGLVPQLRTLARDGQETYRGFFGFPELGTTGLEKLS